VMKRIDNEDVADESAIGLIPKNKSINMEGIEDMNVDMHELFSLPKEFWSEEVRAVEKYLDEQVGDDLPNEIREELKKLDKRVEKL